MHSSSARLSRRQLGALAVGVSAGLLAGCSTDGGEPSDADLLSWLRELPGVAQADYVDNEEDSTGHSALITTTPGLPDDGVRSLTTQIGQGYDDHAPPGSPSLQLQVDRFLFNGRSGTSSDPDLNLERALWLRADGRAVSADGRGGRFKIVATPGTVADLALGFDAVPGKKGRATQEIRTEDGWTAISWSESSGLGWALDRPMVQRIADLQHQYPGLVWWLAADPSQAKAGLFFAADDISLADLIAHRDRLVEPQTFTNLELGWGPARAPYALFAEAFQKGRIRTVLDAVRDLPGVAELRVRDGIDGAALEPDELVVRNGAGYLAGLKALRATWDSFVSVSLVREPARYIGQRPQAVFRSSIFDSGRKARTQAALADLDQIPEFGVGSTFSNLIVAPNIADDQLTTALTALAQLADGGPDPESGIEEPYEVRVYSRFETTSQPVGTARAGAFTRARTMAPGLEVLAGQVQRIWERLT